jgi:hypothetical protein
MRLRFHHLTDPPARRHGPTAFSAVVLAAAVAASLAGCGGDPEPTPTPTPSATATPTPTPTPSPTVPVSVEHDSAWTEDQSEAVRLVEAYRTLDVAMRKDPQNLEYSATMPEIANDPMLFQWMTEISEFRDGGQRYAEDLDVVFLGWYVDPARDVGGRQEIELTYCSTGTGSGIIQADGHMQEITPSQRLRHATAQFIPDVGWRLIKSGGGTEPC